MKKIKKWQRVCSLLSLAFPIIISQLGTIIQGWADTIMVGQYGTPELSAAGLVNNIFNFVLYFLLGISYASTPVVGAYFSKGDHEGVVQARRSSILVNLTSSLFVVLLLFILYINIDILGQPKELLPVIRPYFVVLLWSLPFLAVFNALKQCCEATGDTKTPMVVMLGGNMLNAGLNYLLIFGHLGFPELGLFGAGIATLSSRIIMMSVLLFYRQYNSSDLHKSDWGFQDALRLIRLGIPISTQLCLEAGSFNVCALFMGWIGASALAAHQVMCTVGTFGFMIYYGIGSAAAIRISYYRGQNKWEEVKATARTAVLISFCFSAIVVCVICFFSTNIALLFTSSLEVITLFLSFLTSFVCYQIGDCIQTICANCLRALEDGRYLMISAFISYGLISIPLAYAFAFSLGGGAKGVWWSFPIGLTTAGVLYLYRFNQLIRKHKK